MQLLLHARNAGNAQSGGEQSLSDVPFAGQDFLCPLPAGAGVIEPEHGEEVLRLDAAHKTAQLLLGDQGLVVERP